MRTITGLKILLFFILFLAIVFAVGRVVIVLAWTYDK